ncbi:hypothetical protein D3C71_2229760 [compost metagenome]
MLASFAVSPVEASVAAYLVAFVAVILAASYQEAWHLDLVQVTSAVPAACHAHL